MSAASTHFLPALLEVSERVDRRAVDADFEMEMRPRAVAGAADVADDLAAAHALAAPDCDRALVAVRGGETAAVVDHVEVAVAAHPAAIDDRAGAGGADRRAVADGDV